MCYGYTMEFYSAIKKNEIVLFEGKRMELENIILSEISKSKAKCSLMWKLERNKEFLNKESHKNRINNSRIKEG